MVQVGTGMAEPLRLGGVAEYGLIVARVTSAASLRRGVMPTGGHHGAGGMLLQHVVRVVA
ncbi:hypothetical protein DN051_38655 [Streptomyces cadmiisoli]|uniref:Uncharacterized protein n=1 Tax=Streptomyces cadmiisoli TaxID=2184053 RepID=A0A2Z4JA62_9ACTN|nr:hypothetical protein DN051_38655 [Streptomyces cadmiisoli]